MLDFAEPPDFPDPLFLIRQVPSFLFSIPVPLLSAPSADLISSSNLVGGTHQARSRPLPQWRVRRFGRGVVGVRDGASGVDAPSGYTSQERSREVRLPPQS